MNYDDFILGKTQLGGSFGFDAHAPDFLFDFQRMLVEWSLKKGRSAIFADCGLGKSAMQLAWADMVSNRMGKKVLILTPLSVSRQMVSEAQKFGIDAHRSQDGDIAASNIIVTNYQRLNRFRPGDFAGVVCDESSILKNYEGKLKAEITRFMRKVEFRLLCTATAAPNDYIELGTSSECLGYLGFMDMISKFFRKVTSTSSRKDELRSGTYRFRGHSERDFWRWVCSWSRAIRKPSDFGFDDGPFVLPPLNTEQHIVSSRTPNPEFLFDMPAHGLAEQRAERSRTVEERCEKVASIVETNDEPVVCWCHLNKESDMLKRMIPDSVNVSGKDSDESKEEAFKAFECGDIQTIITKPSIAGYGLNWQHCARQTFFPSHSYEQYYQAVRRSWRFGQDRPVNIDVITTEGEKEVMKNLQRKSESADRLFSEIVGMMKDELNVNSNEAFNTKTEIPSWL